jgi:serine protease AprX
MGGPDRRTVFRRVLLCLALCLTVPLTVGGLAAPAAGSETATWTPTARQKVRPNLRSRLDRDSTARQRVIVVGQPHADRRGMRQLAQSVSGRAFDLLPGFAAEIDRGQVERLTSSDEVQLVQLDGRAHATLDSARHWFGVDATHQAGYVGVAGDASHRSNVAIIDTGIDDSNPELSGAKVVAFQDCTSGGGCFTASPFDDAGHGTHVAGIAAGKGVDPTLQGVAPAVGLVGMKVLDNTGSGFESDIIDAIDRVVVQKDTWHVGVINMSLGVDCGANDPSGNGPPCDGSDALAQAADAAWTAGVTVVVAAGNSGPGIGTVGSPATAHHVISVGIMSDVTPGPSGYSDTPDAGFYLASWSSRGPTSDGRVKPEISGPGVAIRSACSHDASGSEACASASTQSLVLSGTSMASPFVAGTAALMLSADPTLTPDQVLADLQSTAVRWVGDDDPGPAVVSNEAGAGRLDVAAAMTLVAGSTVTGPAVPPHTHVRATLASSGDSATYPIVMADHGSCPLAATLNAPGEGATTPALTLALRQNGSAVSTQGTGGRADVLTKYLAPGTYDLVVTRGGGAGAGVYDLDISGPSPVSSTCGVGVSAFSAVDAGANPASAKPGFTNGDLTLGFTSTPGNTPTSWAVTVDSSTPPPAADPSWHSLASTAFTLSGSDGSHTLYPWLKNAGGDVSSAADAIARAVTITLDTTPPSGIAVTGPAGRVPARATYSASWTTASAGASDRAVVSYTGPPAAVLASDRPTAGSLTAKAPDVEAAATTVRVTVTDSAGNQASGSSSAFRVTGLGGYWADSYGGVHTFGSAPAAGEASRFGVPLARSLATQPTLDGGWLLDGYGGIRAVGAAPNLPPGGPYWSGWDIARDLAVPAARNGGYVLDGYGGVHSFGSVPAVTGAPYFGFDIARRLVLAPGGGGYVLDGYGGVHPFATGGITPAAVSGGPYFGFDIARGLAVQPGPGSTLSGYLLDGYGGVHPLSFAGSPATAAASASGYWSGWDIARGLTFLPDGSGGYVVDGYGGLHPWRSGANGQPPNLPETGYGKTARAVGIR